MKTKEELNQLKKEYETLKNKFQELDKDELEEIVGGHGKNGKPTLDLWDETTTRLIIGGNALGINKAQNQHDIHIYEDKVNDDFKPNFNK